MNTWNEISDGYSSYEDDSWTLYLRLDESGALLEVYDGPLLVTTSNWGPAATTHGDDWCKKQSLKVLEVEKKKRN
jgi:hypothetical protein